jgi:hypothetical protein
MTAVFRHNDVAGGSERYAPRSIELPVLFSLAANRAQVREVADRNAMVAEFRHDQVALRFKVHAAVRALFNKDH